MNKLIKGFCLMMLLSIGIFAQTDNDDYKPNEFYGGFSNQQADGGDRIASRRSLNGFEAAYVRNVHRYVGIKADFSAAYRSDTFNFGIFDPVTGATIASFRQQSRTSLYNVLGGVQIKDNASKARFKPFGHALAGIAHSRARFENLTCTSGNCSILVSTADFTISDTGFGAALGGGLDIKINDKIDFRAIQVDYNPIRINNQWSNNVRFGIGFVFK